MLPTTHKPRSSSRLISKNRKVGRWFLGETLTKNARFCVKKGYDRKDGKVVALKFISKKKNFDKIKIENEIEALRQIRNEHVTQLLAYNLNAKYPEKDASITPTVLIVLEYLPGGCLFDILYYTSALSESIARTYFHQLMDAIQAIHESGVCHRDIKLDNLLLDANFQLKVTHFEHSKIYQPDDAALMRTFYVGTRGYQAPEILKKMEYTDACDIFSCGVVLFMLIAGYPPFETATASCRWYAPLANGNAREFWKLHRCGIPGPAKDLITRMLWYDNNKRISVRGIKRHKWYHGRTLNDRDLCAELRKLHRLMEIKRAEAEKQREMELMKKEKERIDRIVVHGYIANIQNVENILIPLDILHLILSIVRNIEFEYLTEDVYICKIGDKIAVKDSSGIWKKAEIKGYKSIHKALPLTVKLPKNIQEENIGDYWDKIEGVEISYFEGVEIGDYWDEIEGVEISYFDEKYIVNDWIFIENKNIICDCKGKCENKMHQITKPDYNSYFE